MVSQHHNPEGQKQLLEQLQWLKSTVLQFPEHLTASEWVEKYGRLPRETSAEPGKILLYGYQRGLLDAMSDPAISKVSILKSARVGYTALTSFLVGYYIEHEAASVLFAQPTDDDAKDWSKVSFASMVRDTPCLAALKRTPAKGETQDTWSDMIFKNSAVLKIRGAASDDAFRRITTRINIGDEIDGEAWKSDRKNSQGDKLKLMAMRGATYWNSKFIVGSTPTFKHSSIITKSFLESDQRRYFVPCPHCGATQYLKFGGKDFRYGLKWSLDEDGYVDDAWYVCEHCLERIDEKHKRWMDDNGYWQPTAKPKTPGHAGFHLWSGMSHFPDAAWKKIASEFMEARKDPDKLKVFVNTILGEPFEDRKQVVAEFTSEDLEDEIEVYDAEVPEGVLFLTAGCDVQTGNKQSDDPDKAESKNAKPPRVEVSVWGWGRNEESWLIGHYVINGRMDSPDTKAALDQLLLRKFKRADGTTLGIESACIDMGGHFTEAVRDFTRTRYKRRIWAIKGKNAKLGSRRTTIFPRAASRKNSDTWYMIDTQKAKDVIGDKLRLKKEGFSTIHFPHDVSKDYLKGLTSETIVTDKMGNSYWEKTDKKAYGEPLDCFVYALAALHGLKTLLPKHFSDLDKFADAVERSRKHSEAKEDKEISRETVETSKPESNIVNQQKLVIRKETPATPESLSKQTEDARKKTPQKKLTSNFMSRR